MFIIKKKFKPNLINIERSMLLKGNMHGKVAVPGDKSISQRALIIGMLSIGRTEIEDILDSEDVFYTLKAVESLGAKISIEKNKVIIKGTGVGNLQSPKKPIFMGNSGTGARLLIGLVAGSNAVATFYGDNSLNERPMNRIIEPLMKMGAEFIFAEGKRLPITVIGARRRGFTMPIKYKMPIASAQVKSAILLSALSARGRSIIKEPEKTRNNTESMLLKRGADIKTKKSNLGINTIEIKGVSHIKNIDIKVPGDPSSAIFLAVAALITKNSKITINNVFYDEMRLKVFQVLKKMGGKIKIFNKIKNTCSIHIESSSLKNINLNNSYTTALIDEFPILSIAAACGEGKMKMRGLKELKYKESNRLKAIEKGLQKSGVNALVINDDLEINGSKIIKGGCNINALNDHRIAMSFNILNLVSKKPINVSGNSSIVTSFPSFFKTFEKLGIKIKLHE